MKMNHLRMAARRNFLGLSQVQLADMVGMSQQAIAKLERGKVDRPRKLKEIAEQLNTTEEWLLSPDAPDTGIGIDHAPKMLLTKHKVLKVWGIVEAGTWRDAEAFLGDDQITLPVIEHPDYIGFEQFLLKVAGNSMDMFYPADSYVHCVRLQYGPDDVMPQSGDHVIVQRSANGLSESTIKEYKDGKLWPRSHDKRYQEPIDIMEKPVDEVEMTALVVGCYMSR